MAFYETRQDAHAENRYEEKAMEVNAMDEIRLGAKLENLEQVLAFVDERLEAADCPMKAQMQIDVAVEEMFVNIAQYAYAPGSGDAVIQMGIEDGHAVITLKDWGVPFDPLAKEDPDVTLPAEKRRIGGLGIFMVKKSMDDMRYSYENSQNILTIRKKI